MKSTMPRATNHDREESWTKDQGRTKDQERTKHKALRTKGQAVP